MTIHPAPWETDDAAGALQSNMLFPSLDEMCDALPELTERIYAPTLPSAEAEAQTAHGVRKRAASSGAFHGALRHFSFLSLLIVPMPPMEGKLRETLCEPVIWQEA